MNTQTKAPRNVLAGLFSRMTTVPLMLWHVAGRRRKVVH